MRNEYKFNLAIIFRRPICRGRQRNLLARASCVLQCALWSQWVNMAPVSIRWERRGCCVQLFELGWLRISQCVNYKAR